MPRMLSHRLLFDETFSRYQLGSEARELTDRLEGREEIPCRPGEKVAVLSNLRNQK